MREKNIESKLAAEVRRRGGLAPKFVSPGLDGVPDRLILLPSGKAAFAYTACCKSAHSSAGRGAWSKDF